MLNFCNRNDFYYLSKVRPINRIAIHFLALLGRYSPFLNWFKPIEIAKNLVFATKLEASKLNEPYIKMCNEPTFQFTPTSERECYDYLIVGSGPGASQAFDVLSKKFTVAVVERGGFPKTPPQHHHTFFHLANDFYNGGQEFIFGNGLYPFSQGNVLGGGSEVNAGFYHKLPEHLKSDFLKNLNTGAEFWNINEKIVEQMLTPKYAGLDPNKSPIARGAINLDLNYAEIPRWQYIEKQGIVHNGLINNFWIKYKEDCHIFLNSKILKITDESGRYIIEIRQNDSVEKIIESKNLIFSAGAISTPYLLAKLNLIKWRDIKFQWHPMLRVTAQVDPSDLGLDIIDSFQAWDDDHNFKFGSAVSTESLLAFSSGTTLSLENIKKFRSYYVSIASEGLGSFIPKTNIPIYKLSINEKEKLSMGAKKLVNIIESGHGYVDRNARNMLERLNLSTVHVFGTIPIGSSVYLPNSTILKNFKRVQVLDGSILPNPPFVNPQAIIMTTSRIMAEANEAINVY